MTRSRVGADGGRRHVAARLIVSLAFLAGSVLAVQPDSQPGASAEESLSPEFLRAVRSPRPPERPGLAVPVPSSWPEPAVPAHNDFTPEKAELGRHLFYDVRLSRTGTVSCGSCHVQARAFTDPRAASIGATGDVHRRQAMSLANVAYNEVFNWAEERTATLEEQMLVPLFGDHPVEMGLAPDDSAPFEQLAVTAPYDRLIAEAFPELRGSFGRQQLLEAIATFERALVSADAPFDRYTRDGDPTALASAAVRGLELFFSERTACSSCHQGFLFSGGVTWFGREPAPVAFHNTGLYDLGDGAYPDSDQGYLEESGRASDMGRFRPPTLRNVELTAPYMHDGSVPDLESVIEHYDAGGRAASSSFAVEGRRLRSELVRPLGLSAQEKADLLAFLRSLTDRAFVADPAFSDPWSSEGG